MINNIMLIEKSLKQKLYFHLYEISRFDIAEK